MKGAEFLRKVKSLGDSRGIVVRFQTKRGKGSHGTLYFGSFRTVVQDLKKELPPGTLHAMLKQTGTYLEGFRIGDAMRNFVYPATLTPERKGGFTVQFRDLPEAITSGKDSRDALVQAADCLEKAIAGRIADELEIPEPSAALRKQILVPLPAPMAAKAALYLAMRDTGVSKSALARRLNMDEKEIRRMLDPRHATRLYRIQKVLEALGKRLVIGFESAA